VFTLFATGVIDTGGKYAAGIVDTGGKFVIGINNTSETGGKICHWCGQVVHLDLQISPNLNKNLKRP
jgi:hypothetical protein